MFHSFIPVAPSLDRSALRSADLGRWHEKQNLSSVFQCFFLMLHNSWPMTYCESFAHVIDAAAFDCLVLCCVSQGQGHGEHFHVIALRVLQVFRPAALIKPNSSLMSDTGTSAPECCVSCCASRGPVAWKAFRFPASPAFPVCWLVAYSEHFSSLYATVSLRLITRSAFVASCCFITAEKGRSSEG